MGRGRQKAKATKQARDIKYYSPNTDYSALQRELKSSEGRSPSRFSSEPVEPDYSALQRELTGPGSRATSHFADDPVEPDYSAYVDKYADDVEDDDDEVDSRRIG